MAKKKEGAGQGVIITLVFFVILTLVMGALAYFGYQDQETLTADKVKAEKELKTAQVSNEELQARVFVDRIAMGVEDPKDRSDLENYIKTRQTAISDELNIIKAKAGAGFKWDNAGDGPAAKPEETMRERQDRLSKELAAAQTAAKSAQDDAAKARSDADNQKAQQVKNKETFDAEIRKLEEKYVRLNKDHEELFRKYTADLNKAGQTFAADANVLKDQLDESQRAVRSSNLRVEKLSERVKKEDALKSFDGPDLIKGDLKKGSIVRVDGEFVTLSIGSAVNLRPTTTFAVIPAGVTWRDAKEKEKLIKGRLEVVAILGPYASQAKITGQSEPIRNPITAGDDIYNPAWSANERIHVAFTGAIDLHGTGYDSNDEFIRKLESMGVVIDSYLDLKTQTIRNRGDGIDLNTKFLVIGPDAKQESSENSGNKQKAAVISAVSEAMGKMKLQAKENGVQIVEARKFLNYMGVRIPERAEYLDYSYLDKAVIPPAGGAGESAAPKEKN